MSDAPRPKVLVFSLNYSPELTGVGKYSAEMAEWLGVHGFQVRVVTGWPYYPGWRVFDGFSGWRYRKEVLAGVEVWRCPLWVPKHPTAARRILHLGSFCLFSIPVMIRHLFWRADVVFAIAPTLLGAPLAMVLAKLSRAKAWLHVQDFEIDVAYGLGLFESRVGKRILYALERLLMLGFDKISSITPPMLVRLSDKGIPLERQFLFPNWVDIDVIRPACDISPLRKELGIASEQKVVLYAGNFGEKQGLEVVVEAARHLSDRSDIVFTLAGAGPARSRIEELARHLPNVRWLPLQPVERLNDLLNLADIHVLPQRADAADLVMPSKLTGMLASGRPVLATAAPGTQLARVVELVGRVVAPEDAPAMADAIRCLCDNPHERRRLGEAARRYSEVHFAKDPILRSVVKALVDLGVGTYGSNQVGT